MFPCTPGRNQKGSCKDLIKKKIVLYVYEWERQVVQCIDLDIGLFKKNTQEDI